jgi:uncharacterized membrane protein YhaH (DUF805 family)
MDWQAAKDWVVWVFSESHMGRVGRWDYLRQRVMLILAALALGFGGWLLSAAGSILVLTVYILVGIPVWFVLFYRGITLDIQRLHDFGVSGWWLALVLVLGALPFFGLFVAVAALGVFLLVPGTAGENRFGPGRVEVPVARTVSRPAAQRFDQMVKAAPARKRRGKAKVKAKAKPVKARKGKA